MNNKIKFALLLFFATLSASNAVRCYQCTYTSTPPYNSSDSCKGQNVDKSYLNNCPPSLTRCSTTVLTTTILVKSESIVRSCASPTDKEGCTDTSLLKSCVSLCTGDGCNGAGYIKSGLFSLSVPIVVTVLISLLLGL